MTTPDFIKAMLAVLMWRENGPDGLQGMIAVGLVAGNRVRAGWQGGDWCKVMEAWDHGNANLIVWPDTRDPQFQAVLGKVDTIFTGQEPDITGGALYYVNLSLPVNPWFLENIVQKPDEHPRIGTVGQRTFFG